MYCVQSELEIDTEVRLENGVAQAGYQAKASSRHTRLALECSRSSAQANCVPGQKWRCERDGQRWRRHKCHHPGVVNASSQEILIPVPRNAWKKCACFTPNGVVYTRLEANDFDGKRFVFGKESRFTGPYGQVQAIAPRRGRSDTYYKSCLLPTIYVSPSPIPNISLLIFSTSFLILFFFFSRWID